ncbi:MAG TPA: SAM-dependent methyltransferase [Bacteroidia bacterium]|nr:SAM-dependent methyltransferase [Bacteroidia bacterium]
MPTSDLETFISLFTKGVVQEQLLKLTLSDRRDKANELENVFVKPVLLKTGLSLSFVYRHPTKDITKNYKPEEAEGLIRELLNIDFYKADLFTEDSHTNFSITKSGKSFIKQQSVTGKNVASTEHDRGKRRYVKAENNIWLKELGVTTAEGKVKSDKQDKYRQINKYVEIVESIVKDAALPSSFQITDMGSGKGYLTFALYDYLTNQLNLQPTVTGVEMRKELIDVCNSISSKTGFDKLNFIQGSIDNAELPATDMLIALHACDIATDQAIYRGIKSNAQVIICAPCCHKQLRKQIHPTNDLKAISKFGILEERQSEILTDTIRALIMEAYGYKTKVFEFISTEHTPKNVLIVGIKTKQDDKKRKDILEQIKNIKALFNIEYHQLEKLMEI